MKKSNNTNPDFDFIRRKINTSGINAPEDIDEQFVMDAISDKTAERIKFPTKRVVSYLSSAVAVIAIFAVIITALPHSEPPITASASELDMYESYDDIKADLKGMGVQSRYKQFFTDNIGNRIYPFAYSVDKSTAINESLESSVDYDMSAPVDDYAVTYKQVDSVDEPDIIKTDGRYIYFADSYRSVYIYPANGKDSKPVAEIKQRMSKDYNLQEMFVHNGLLIVLYDDYYNSETKVAIYDITDAENPKRVQNFAQSGVYSTARMIGDRLYIVSNQFIANYDALPYVVCKGTKETLPASSICRVSNPCAEYLVINAIDTEKMDKKSFKTKAILGASADVYCNEENMYITCSMYEEHEKTQIIKVSLNSDGVDFVASAIVDGYLYSQYAMDESNGYLRVATTMSFAHDINQVVILDDKLNEVGSTKPFAKDETIKAVKYIGDYAYVITFVQTDPLFVIDLSDPKSPRILGEAKIDGFSTMLVPVGDDKLLGIGYEAEDSDTGVFVNGIKLALFDISDKTSPEVLDERVFKDYTSAVQFEPKALVYNPQRDCYTIPFEGTALYDAGCITFHIDGEKIDVDDEFSFEDVVCDSTRCTYVDDTIYVISYNQTHAVKYKN